MMLDDDRLHIICPRASSLCACSCRGLKELWDTLGVCGVASMPPALKGYSYGGGTASVKGGQQPKSRLVLAPEASTALTLVVDLASSHVRTCSCLVVDKASLHVVMAWCSGAEITCGGAGS